MIRQIEGLRQVTPPIAEHGEGPVYWQGWQTSPLRWVDMLRGDILTLSPTDDVRRHHVGSVAAALRPRSNGGMVVATERGFALFDSGPITPDAAVYTTEVWTDPAVRMNDGGCDPQGGFLCGSMSYAGAPQAGSLYRLTQDLTVETVMSDVTVSNGLGWNAAGTTAYYIDSATQRLDSITYEQGQFGSRSTLVHFDEADGIPDGLCLDAADHIWVAMHGGGAVHRYSPDGVRDATVKLPVSQVTACTLGGSDLRTLYITTSRLGLDADAEDQAGALFAVEVDVAGPGAASFGG